MVLRAPSRRSTLLLVLLLLSTSARIATPADAQNVPSNPRPIPGNSPVALQKNAVPISPSASTSASEDSALRSHSHQGAHLGPVDPDARSNTGTTWKGNLEELPSRWKDYLPRAVGGSSSGERRSGSSLNGGLSESVASSPTGYSGFAGTSSLSPQAARGTVKVTSSGAPQQSRTPRQGEVYDEPDEADDDDDDEDDDDDGIWRAYQEKKEEEALLRRHLKSRARQEALRAGKSARRAAQVVLPNKIDQETSSFSSEDSHHSLMDGLKALWSTFAACFGFVWYSFRLCTRYISLSTRFLWSALRFSLRYAGRAFLIIWATGRYFVRQVLRPLRVVGAPVVYLFLGVKWTFWDWPSYYVFRMMREVYPLYVFLGAALALGTAIGLSSSVMLYLGSFLFRSSSPLESHLSSWKGSELSELDRRLEVGVQKGAAAIDTALGGGGAIGGQAKKSRKSSRGVASKKSSTSRAGAEESLIDRAMRERAQSRDGGPSPPRRESARQRTSAEDVREQEEDLPDFLKGLGSSWKPLPRAREGATAHAHSGEAESSADVRTGTGTSTDTTGEEDEHGEPEDYFSVPPATQRRSSAPSSAKGGSGGGGLSPYNGLSPYAHPHHQQHTRPATTGSASSAYSSALPPGNSYGYKHGHGHAQGVSPLSHPASASGSTSTSTTGSSSSSTTTGTRRRRSLPSHGGNGSGMPSPPAHFGAGAVASHSPLGLYGQPISLAAGVGVGGNLPVGATGRRSRGVHAR